MIRIQRPKAWKRKGTYRLCSCGKKLSSANRESIIRHTRLGHKVAMRHYTKEEIENMKGMRT